MRLFHFHGTQTKLCTWVGVELRFLCVGSSRGFLPSLVHLSCCYLRSLVVTAALCLPAGSTYYFSTSSSQGSNQKNGGFKKKSPKEDEGTYVPKTYLMAWILCVCEGHGWRAWKISLNAHLWVLQTSCNLPTVRAHGYEPVGRGIFVLADGRIKLNQAMKLILFMCSFASCANNFIVFALILPLYKGEWYLLSSGLGVLV